MPGVSIDGPGFRVRGSAPGATSRDGEEIRDTEVEDSSPAAGPAFGSTDLDASGSPSRGEPDGGGVSTARAVALVRRLGGPVRTRELRRAGISRHDLGAAVRAGLLVRPRRGIYCLPDTSSAILEALSHCGRAACVSASRDYGLWTLDLGPEEHVHTWVDPDHRPVRVALDPDEGPACCVFHRDAPLDPPERGRVGIVHALRQMLACRGVECFFAALESALKQGLLDDDRRNMLRRALPRRDKWLVDFARTDADSGLESILRLRLHRHGLTLTSQVPIPGVGTVDFVIGDCLILEADGATHGGENRHRDLVRDAIAAALGFSTLRFDSALILHDWPTVEAAILGALRRNLHRSQAGMTW